MKIEDYFGIALKNNNFASAAKLLAQISAPKEQKTKAARLLLTKMMSIELRRSLNSVDKKNINIMLPDFMAKHNII